MDFVTNLNLNKNELRNARVQNLATAPGTPVGGQIYTNTAGGVGNYTLQFHNGSTFVSLGTGTGSGTVTSVALAMPAGFTVSGSPVTSAGTITITTTLSGVLKGTGSGFAVAVAGTDYLTPTGNGSGLTNLNGSQITTGTVAPARLPTLDAIPAPVAPVALNAQRITGLAEPTGAQDAATKSYVDAARAGLDTKQSVRVATVVAGALATAFASGQLVDGVTLQAADRLLIKNQATGSENGIYTVNASGAPTRAADADVSADVTPGMYVFVEAGAVNGDTGWVLSTDAPITLGTTALTFVQFSSAGVIVPGAGLTQTGTALNVGAGTGIVVGADDVALAGQALALHNLATNGLVTRTGAATVTSRAIAGTANQIAVSNGDGVAGSPTIAFDPNARTTLGAAGKYTQTIGDGAATSFSITQAVHGLAANGSILVATYDAATGIRVYPDETVAPATGAVTIAFTLPPTANQFRVVLIG